MSVVLALDTTTDHCSVAIAKHGEIIQSLLHAPRQQNAHIHSMIESVLSETKTELSALTHIALTIGPGSFTGVRLGLSVAQGLAFGLQCPLVPVMTLDAMALGLMQHKQNDAVLIALDARMQEMYWAEYDLSGDVPICLNGPNLTAPEHVVPHSESVLLYGSAWHVYQDKLSHTLTQKVVDINADTVPEAQYVAQYALMHLHTSQAPHSVTALYLRNNVVS